MYGIKNFVPEVEEITAALVKNPDFDRKGLMLTEFGPHQGHGLKNMRRHPKIQRRYDSMANCACGGQLKKCTKCGTILCGHSNQGGTCKKGTPHPIAGTCPRCKGTVKTA